MWLVLGGCGSAVLAATFPDVGIGLTGVSLAFGLTVLTMAYALGPISGGHFNPAVSCGLWAAGRFPANKLAPYIVVQVAGAVAGAAILFVIASGKAGFDVSAGFAANGYGEHSPGKYSLASALVTEVVMTFGFLVVILRSDSPPRASGICGHCDRAGAHLIHLVSIPVTNTSVNWPAARDPRCSLVTGRWGSCGSSGSPRSPARCWPAGFPGHCGNTSTPSWSRPWRATGLRRAWLLTNL
jgi:aquaporin Z